MSFRDKVITKAEAIKASVDVIEAAFDAEDLGAAKDEFARLHVKLSGAVNMAVEHFGGTAEEFSGGTDKPPA